jgi:hypothetical protein
MGYAIQVVFGFEYTMFIGYLMHSATSHLGVLTHMELIWIVDFKFGAHKMETMYIPSN